MGGTPVVAVNLLVLAARRAAHRPGRRGAARRPGRAPRRRLPGGRRAQRRRPRAEVRHGGHRHRRPRTGCCATTPASPGLPLSLTKPLGIGVLNTRHKPTGEVFPEAVATMAELNARRRRAAALAAGVTLRHRRHRVRAAGPPLQAGPGERRHRGHRRRGRALPRRRARRAGRRLRQRGHPTQPRLGPRRTWTLGGTEPRTSALLLADAQTSGGLLVAGEIPGAPVIGELRPLDEHHIVVR